MTIIQEMKEHEKMSRMFQKISHVMKPHRYQAITRLGIPKNKMNSPTEMIWKFLQEKEKTKEHIDWEYTEDEDPIKFRLREWNILHFNQSIETPLASAEWEKKLSPDKLLSSNITDVIQEAIESDNNLHQASVCLLQEMKKVCN